MPPTIGLHTLQCLSVAQLRVRLLGSSGALAASRMVNSTASHNPAQLHNRHIQPDPRACDDVLTQASSSLPTARYSACQQALSAPPPQCAMQQHERCSGAEPVDCVTAARRSNVAVETTRSAGIRRPLCSLVVARCAAAQCLCLCLCRRLCRRLCRAGPCPAGSPPRHAASATLPYPTRPEPTWCIVRRGRGRC